MPLHPERAMMACRWMSSSSCLARYALYIVPDDDDYKENLAVKQCSISFSWRQQWFGIQATAALRGGPKL
jgi:hypothetical protein